jgi:hypothetical protein
MPLYARISQFYSKLCDITASIFLILVEQFLGERGKVVLWVTGWVVLYARYQGKGNGVMDFGWWEIWVGMMEVGMVMVGNWDDGERYWGLGRNWGGNGVDCVDGLRVMVG